MTVQDGDGREPVVVRVVRGLIATLIWAALALPIFVAAVGVVLFLAFVLEPYSGGGEDEGDRGTAGDG